MKAIPGASYLACYERTPLKTDGHAMAQGTKYDQLIGGVGLKHYRSPAEPNDTNGKRD